jgi:hypothetical protein
MNDSAIFQLKKLFHNATAFFAFERVWLNRPVSDLVAWWEDDCGCHHVILKNVASNSVCESAINSAVGLDLVEFNRLLARFHATGIAHVNSKLQRETTLPCEDYIGVKFSHFEAAHWIETPGSALSVTTLLDVLYETTPFFFEFEEEMD